MATNPLKNQTTSEENTTETLTSASQPSSTDESCKEVSAKKEINGDSIDPISAVEKKMRRAERFGMPVNFSEQEKRNSRAERFGTGPISPGADALKDSEEQKRKTRAERFGVSGQSVNEEAKKKARLEKFAPADSKNDPVEEDKRKARAARFSQEKSTSVSNVKDEEIIDLKNIEPKATTEGNANGGD